MRAGQIDQFWDIDNLITKATLVDCGGLSVEFFNDDASQTSLDTDIFLDDRATGGAFNLASKYTEDVGKTKSYNLKYRVYHTSYDQNVVTLAEPFSILVADPCDAPVSLTPSALDDKEYILTTSAQTY